MLAAASVLTVLQLVLDSTPVARDLPVAAIAWELRAIWQPYVDVVLLRDQIAVSPDYPILHLQVTDAAQPGGGPASHALGWIEFVEGAPQPLITVSRARAERLLDSATWMGRPLLQLPALTRQELLARVLARGIAHEVGHFVMRSQAHRPSGLMRAQFSTGELIDRRLTRFRLTPADQARLAAVTPDRLVAGIRMSAPGVSAE